MRKVNAVCASGSRSSWWTALSNKITIVEIPCTQFVCLRDTSTVTMVLKVVLGINTMPPVDGPRPVLEGSVVGEGEAGTKKNLCTKYGPQKFVLQ